MVDEDNFDENMLKVLGFLLVVAAFILAAGYGYSKGLF